MDYYSVHRYRITIAGVDDSVITQILAYRLKDAETMFDCLRMQAMFDVALAQLDDFASPHYRGWMYEAPLDEPLLRDCEYYWEELELVSSNVDIDIEKPEIGIVLRRYCTFEMSLWTQAVDGVWLHEIESIQL